MCKTANVINGLEVVGATGFEPATSCSQSKCSTRLSYAPTRTHIPMILARSNDLLFAAWFLMVRLRRNFPKKPGAGVRPIIVGGAGGDAENFGGFLQSHPDEITQLHQFGFELVLSGEFVEGVIDGQELIVINWHRDFHAFNVHPLLIAAVTDRLFAAGLVNQDATHGLGGSGEEVRAVLKLRLTVIAHQTQPRLMHERGGLQSLVRRFVGHSRRRQFAQFAIDQRQQFIGGFGITVFDGLKYARDIAQSATITRCSGAAPENWPLVPCPLHTGYLSA